MKCYFMNLNYLVDCEWDVWSPWNGCSVTCGDGTANRVRTVKTEAQCEGQICEDPDTESTSCNLECCPGTYVVSINTLIKIYYTVICFFLILSYK